MTGILLSRGTLARHRDAFAAAAREAGIEPRVLHLPDDPTAQLAPADIAGIEIAYLSSDIRFSGLFEAFCKTLSVAPNLQWAHFTSAAIDGYPFLQPLTDRKVRLTTSTGSNSDPVAQTAIGGLLMLARHFPHWWAAQGRRAWGPMKGAAAPRDLNGQTVLIVGLGNIGMTIARFCRTLGLHVIGVRRGPRQPDDPAHEVHTLAALPALLPRCDWVVLACPLTPETRGVINARALNRLPRGARLINIARGGLVDEPALIEALKNGQLGGAYLDVFEQEPLPADSPLWTLPNVILSPHNAAMSSGNNDRAMRIFLDNLVNLAQGRPLQNEVALA